jgi:hypothetical protein
MFLKTKRKEARNERTLYMEQTLARAPSKKALRAKK